MRNGVALHRSCVRAVAAIAVLALICLVSVLPTGTLGGQSADAASTPNTYTIDADANTAGTQSSITKNVGETFTIAVNIGPVVDAYQAFQSNVLYDTAALTASNAVEHPNGFIGSAASCSGALIDPGTMTLFEGCSLSSGSQSNTGTTAKYDITCVAGGTTTLHLQTSAELGGSGVSTNFGFADGSVGDPITQNATVTCAGGPPTATATFTLTPTATATATRTFTPTPSATATATSSPTITLTPTLTPTNTPCPGPGGCDTDGDGMPNAYEGAHPCLNPNAPDGGADPDHDGLSNVNEFTVGSDPCTFDTDGDMCGDGTEVHRSGREGDPLNPYDFYTVPAPALRVNPAGTRDESVGVTSDVIALLAYTGLTATSPDYVADRNGNGVPDGREYDRSAIIRYGIKWPDAPDGAIGITSDVQAMLNQVGMSCPPLDTDGDGIPDRTDPDDDNDGMPDTYEVQHGCLNSLVADGANDADGDGLTSYQEYIAGTNPCVADTDGDGIPDGFEASHGCLNPLVADGGGDPDSDTLTTLYEYTHNMNPCSADSDGDGLPDGYEVAHSCLSPTTADAGADPDGDALANGNEFSLGTDPCVADTDGDGMPDGFEASHNCLNPVGADGGGDPDADGLTSINEYTRGMNPCSADSDSDGLPDGYEVAHFCLNPIVADGNADPDGDGLSNANEFFFGADPCNPDTDGDGLPDGQEVQIGTNPLNPDTDGDGCRDGTELGPNHFFGGQRDPTSPWDFYDVPFPALRLSASGSRDRAVGITTDVNALFRYVPMTSSDADYMADYDHNGQADGLQYDRSLSVSPGEPWRSGPPNGAIGVTTDVVAMLAQVSNACSP